MGDPVRLRWIGHHGTIMSSFHTLLASQSMVDVTLACDGKYIRAHQLILSSSSSYFQALLSIDTTKHPIFFLKDVKFTELEAIIEYIYCGEVVISKEDFPSFLAVAKALKINGLANVQTETNTTTSDPIIHNDQAGISRDTMAPPPLSTVDVAPPSLMVHTPTISSNVGVPMPFQQQQSQMSSAWPISAHIVSVLDSPSLMFQDTDTFGTSVMKLEGYGPIEGSVLLEEEYAARQSGSSESWQMDCADNSEMLDDDYDEELRVQYGSSSGTGAEGGEGHPNLILTMTSPSNVTGQHTTTQNLHQSIGVLSVSAPTAVVPNSTNAVSVITSQNNIQTTDQNAHRATGNQRASADFFDLAEFGYFEDCQRQEFNEQEKVEDVQHDESVDIKVRKFSLAPPSAGQGSPETNPVFIDCCNNDGVELQTSLEGNQQISGKSARRTRNNGLGVDPTEDEVLDFPGTYQPIGTRTTGRQDLASPDYFGASQLQAFSQEEIDEEMQPEEPADQKVTKYSLVPPSDRAGKGNSEKTPVVIDGPDSNQFRVPRGVSGGSSRKYASGMFDGVLDFPGTYQPKATATTSRQDLLRSDYVGTSHCQGFSLEEIVEEMQPAEPVEQKLIKYSLVPPSAAAGKGNSEKTPVVIDCHDTNEVRVPLGNSLEFEGTSGDSSKKYPSGVSEVQGEGSGLSHSTTLRVTYPLISFGRSAQRVPTVYHENRRFKLPTSEKRMKPTTWHCSNNCAGGCNAVLTTDGDKLLGYTVHNDKCRPLPPQNEEAHTERDTNGRKEVMVKRPKYTKIMTKSKSASPWAGKTRQRRVSVPPKKCPCCQDKPKHKHN